MSDMRGNSSNEALRSCSRSQTTLATVWIALGLLYPIVNMVVRYCVECAPLNLLLFVCVLLFVAAIYLAYHRSLIFVILVGLIVPVAVMCKYDDIRLAYWHLVNSLSSVFELSTRDEAIVLEMIMLVMSGYIGFALYIVCTHIQMRLVCYARNIIQVLLVHVSILVVIFYILAVHTLVRSTGDAFFVAVAVDAGLLLIGLYYSYRTTVIAMRAFRHGQGGNRDA